MLFHWLGDFVVQTDWQAKNKSRRWDALLKHVGTYTLTLCLLLPWYSWRWVLVQGVLHLLIDFWTSRLNRWLWEKRGSHDFFVGVGLDQWLHAVCLLTLWT